MEPANHTHTDAVKAVTRAARNAGIDAALKWADTVDVWLIHSTPTPTMLNKYREQGAHIITVDPGKQTVMSRVKRQRPPHMLAVAGKWYDTQSKPSKPQPKRDSTTARGYGHKHQKRRDKLMRALTDGQTCEWCGKPMYRNAKRNWDEAALEADHGKPLANDSSALNLATRLLHRTCNRQRGAGRPNPNMHDTNNPLHKPVNKPVNKTRDKPAGQADKPINGGGIFEW